MCTDDIKIIAIRHAVELGSVQTLSSSGLGREECDDGWKEGPPVVLRGVLWRPGDTLSYLTSLEYFISALSEAQRNSIFNRAAESNNIVFLQDLYRTFERTDSAMCYCRTSVTDNENVDFCKQGTFANSSRL